MGRGDRYLMIELRGYAQHGGRGAVSFSILDSCRNYEEVYVVYAGWGGNEAKRRAKCEAKLRQLNQEERAWEKQ